MYETIIEDYRQTIERLQQECTEKTNNIIQLGGQLHKALQELNTLQNIPRVEESVIEEDREAMTNTMKVLQQAHTTMRALVEERDMAQALAEDLLDAIGISVDTWEANKEEIRSKLKETNIWEQQ